jgi:hypothetical protein
VSQTDYYRLKAVFEGVKHGEREIRPPDDEQRQRSLEAVKAELAALHRRIAALQPVARLGRTLVIDDLTKGQTAHLAEPRGTANHAAGTDGGLPSHRGLLDWLASELVDPADRWRLKRLQRLIVTSRAYRQASTARDDGLAADAAARLVWRYPPRRLEAEPLRDAILAVSGSLVNEPGGPGDRDRLRPAGQGGGGRGGPRGESGTMTSELLPRLGELADEMCFIHSMTTKSNTHGPAESQMATGFTLDGFPSIGAWTTYALGSECRDLPAFVAIPDPRRRAADRAAAVAERLPARLLPGHALQR